MKAWVARDKFDDDKGVTIVFADNANRAKTVALSTESLCDSYYTDIRVNRFKPLDNKHNEERELDWNNTENRLMLINDFSWYCIDTNIEECEQCLIHNDCSRYKEYIEE